MENSTALEESRAIAALKRSTQQALHNAAVTIENVHLRYECETKYDMLQGFAACGVTVRELIIGDGWQAAADEREEEEAEARRDRDRDAKAKGREEPEARARSTACSVTQFGLYCEPERQRKKVKDVLAGIEWASAAEARALTTEVIDCDPTNSAQLTELPWVVWSRIFVGPAVLDAI